MVVFSKKYLATILISLHTLMGISQSSNNLVLNYSFEDTILLGYNPYKINNVIPPWFAAQESADYISTVFSVTKEYFSDTTNHILNLSARTGYAYVGEYLFTHFSYDFLELVGGKLSSPLRSGKKYCVQFFYKNEYLEFPAKHYSSDGLGIYFSTDSITSDTCCILNLTPQIENPEYNYLYDTTWAPFTGDFIATGGEQYFLIGNFKDLDDTHIDPPQIQFAETYYFFDDVSVWLCEADTAFATDSFDKGSSIPLLPLNTVGTQLHLKGEPLIIPTLISAKDLYWQFINLQPNTEVKLYNALGQLVYATLNYQNNRSTNFLAAGVYFYEVQLESGERLNGKVVCLR